MPSAACYEAEQLQDAKEALVLFQLLMEDIRMIRRVVQHTWEGYRLGMCNLVSTSITTNTAVDLVRRMEEDSQSIFDKHGGSEHLHDCLYVGNCFKHGEDPELAEEPRDCFNIRMYDVAEQLFLPTYCMLRAFYCAAGEGDVPTYNPVDPVHYNPSDDRSLMTDREKLGEDKAVLMGMLPKLGFFCRATPGSVPGEDSFITGLRETLHGDGKIPVWLTFAAQLFLDSHHVLRGKVSRGYEVLYAAVSQMESSIKETLDYHQSLRVVHWPRCNDLSLKQFLDRVEWVKKDKLQDAKREDDWPLGEPFHWFKQHPNFAGLYLYHLEVRYQELGVLFAGAWGSVIYAGHLYNAVLQENHLNHWWHDMELLFMLHCNFFIGERPTTPDDYLKRCFLSGGVSASEFAKDRRKKGGRMRKSKAVRKGLTELAPVARMFRERYCGETSSLTTDDLEKIVSAGMWKEKEEDIAANGGCFRTFARNKPMSKKQWQQHRRLTPPQLLLTLRDALDGEALEFRFDYFMMHRICWSLLRSVERHCRQGLADTFGPKCIEEENQLPHIVGYIFRAAADADMIDARSMKRNQNIVTSALLVEAAEAVRDSIQGGVGEAVIQKMGVSLKTEGGAGSDIEGISAETQDDPVVNDSTQVEQTPGSPSQLA